MRNKPGRPANGLVDCLNIQLWYFEIAERLGVTSSYAVEKYYKENQPDFRPPFRNTNQFKKYEKGNFFPGKEITDWFESRSEGKFKGTSKLLHHPFWRLLKAPAMPHADLYTILHELPADILIHLPWPSRALRYSTKVCSFDSLAVCLWLICERRHHFSDSPLKIFYPATLNFILILSCMASHDPFLRVAKPLYQYFKDTFLPKDKKDDIHKMLQHVKLDGLISKNALILKIIDETSILSQLKDAPPSCLYLAQKHLPDNVISEVMPLINSKKWRQLKRHDQVKKLTASLKRWEKNILSDNALRETPSQFT